VKGGAAPSLAVVVPNRNDAGYLRLCLESILGQEVLPDELILVDDQSSDDSVRIARSLLAGCAFAQVIENPVNLGTYGALREGLKRSRSDYVLFLASNDYVLPGIFARAKTALASAPQAAIWSALVWLVDEDGRTIRLHNSPIVALHDRYFAPDECIDLAWRHGTWFTGPTLTYRRKELEEVGFFDPALGGLADLISALGAAARGGAAYSPEPLAAIRLHSGGNLSRTLTDSLAFDAMLARLAERGPRIAPQLFTAPFLKRTARRFRFAAVRAAAAGAWAPLRWLRVAAAFAVLRPFDLLPTLWSRLAAWSVVRLRASPPPPVRGRAG
jgi:glycosyltransferase involved in cell wall biosynthesis